MKSFESMLLDNKNMHGVYDNKYLLWGRSNHLPEQLLNSCTRLNTTGSCCGKAIIMSSSFIVNQ